MPADSALVVFTKPARPGRVKTRLIGRLTAREAAALHQAFLDDLVARLETGGFELWIAWALEADDEPPQTDRAWLRQTGSDLGERLFNALCALTADHPYVAAVGSDHPDLSLQVVEQAFALLADGAPVVLGPAEDGGYYLVGVRREALSARLFAEIPWSEAGVLAATLDRCAELGLAPTLLPRASDVDTPADLDRLELSLSGGAVSCPRTAELLRSFSASRALE